MIQHYWNNLYPQCLLIGFSTSSLLALFTLYVFVVGKYETDRALSLAHLPDSPPPVALPKVVFPAVRGYYVGPGTRSES